VRVWRWGGGRGDSPWRRVVERPVITLPQFWLLPLAKAFADMVKSVWCLRKKVAQMIDNELVYLRV
jgi:hypothetical protein